MSKRDFFYNVGEWFSDVWYMITRNVREERVIEKYEEEQYERGLKEFPALVRYPDDHSSVPPFRIHSIEVETEEDKEQLLLACRYLHDQWSTDTGFVAVNNLVHLYECPDLIVVRQKGQP